MIGLEGATLYASEGRPSIPPEQLLSALLLQVFYGVRSERQLMEQLNYNLRVGGSNPSERAKNTYVHDDDFGIQTPNSRNRAPL